MVARAGGARYVADRGLRAAGGASHLLGPAVAALPRSDRCPRSRMGGDRHPRVRARAVRHGAGHRARPDRHRDGPAPRADRESLMAFAVEAGLGALLLLVFLATIVGRG